MDFLSYYLDRARRSRGRALAERSESNRRAWIELAEIMEARCLLYLVLDPERSLETGAAKNDFAAGRSLSALTSEGGSAPH